LDGAELNLRPTEKFMRIILSALLSLSLIAGLAGVAAAPASAEKVYTKKKHKRYHARRYRSYDQSGYYERWADRLPIGSSIWWHQMDREQRGGRR
jgi:hypothetical protein